MRGGGLGVRLCVCAWQPAAEGDGCRRTCMCIHISLRRALVKTTNACMY